ncbi:MAG TPA: DUF5947 family protein [Gemmatimonadaceae bacterium]
MNVGGESRLAKLAAQSRAPIGVNRSSTESVFEQCDLCSAIVPVEHQHLVDIAARRIVCACRACATLFDNAAISGRQYRLIPDGVRRLIEPHGADAFWAELAIPVDLAFFFFDSTAQRVVALYPGPMGVAECQLPLGAWETFASANDVLRMLQPDVEALLVNRTKEHRDYWLVPIDACYTLAGVMRSHWKGLGGGDDVWHELDRFFDGLEARAVKVS